MKNIITKKRSKIYYDHALNVHTLKGPLNALSIIFPKGPPRKILDIGCGTGTWLCAAKKMGTKEVFGVDGIKIPNKKLLIDNKEFKKCDLRKKVKIKQKFDLVLCLEVAEHLDEKYSDTLIKTLTSHAKKIIFSAACPGQKGQNHINCQWPDYWQKKFNKFGYSCFDSIRPKIWDKTEIEPWYRQNIFIAKKSAYARREKRIAKIKHPDLFPVSDSNEIDKIQKGSKKIRWYFALLIKAIYFKVSRKIKWSFCL